jgi:hypothetical protein
MENLVIFQKWNVTNCMLALRLIGVKQAQDFEN